MPRKVLKSVDNTTYGERKSTVTYNPYTVKDYKKVQVTVQTQKPARGLGSNKGDERWNLANDIQERKKKFSDNLRSQNKKFGLMNADKQFGAI